MKAIIVTTNGCKGYEVAELGKHYKIVGYTEDFTELRKQGAVVHRAELDNQPILEGLCGPMWDWDMLRYEDWETYNLLSN